MRQVLSALTLSAGLMAFPVTALADHDESDKHKKYSELKQLRYDKAAHDYRSDRRE